MKTILNFVVLTFLLVGSISTSQAQTVSKAQFYEFRSNILERLAEIEQSIPEGSSDRNTGLTPFPDTVISGYNGAEEDIISFIYENINGEKLPVSLTFNSSTGEDIGTIVLGYDAQNRLASLKGTVVEEGEEIPVDVTYEYDENDNIVKTITKTEFVGLPIEITFETEIVRNGNGLIEEITNYQGTASIFFNDYSKTESITQIIYDENIPVSYFRYEYFPDEFEELDSVTYRYSNIVWYEYNNNLLRQMLGEESDFEFSTDGYIESPSLTHLDRIVSGTIEELVDGEWVVFEEIILNEMSASGYDISIESFINTREVISLDENKFLVQKDLFYEFDGDEVSEREIYTYTDFQLEESYQRFLREEDELVLDISNQTEYSFDDNDRLVLINETSNIDDDYTTRFIYSGTSSNFEKGLQNTFVELFPNPVANEILVKSPEFRMLGAAYTIFDINGKVVLNAPVVNSPINVSNLTAGLYILQLRNTDQIATVKFTKI